MYISVLSFHHTSPLCVGRDERKIVITKICQPRHKGRNKAKGQVEAQWETTLSCQSQKRWDTDSRRQVKSCFMSESKLQRPPVRRTKCKSSLLWHPHCMFSYIIHDTTTWPQICSSAYGNCVYLRLCAVDLLLQASLSLQNIYICAQCGDIKLLQVQRRWASRISGTKEQKYQ